MKTHSKSFVRPVRDGQRGQTLWLVAALLPVLLGMAALVIDLGNLYFSYQELNSATNAAALAGGAAIPNPPSGLIATAVACDYSSLSSCPSGGAGLNQHPNLLHVSESSGVACVTPATYPNLGLPPCAVYPNSGGACATAPGCNMIEVSQTAYVGTFFAKMFGIATVKISATAVASAKGVGGPPYHIMVVLDTTASMGQGSDSGCTSNGTSYSPEFCAQYGIQTLLLQLDPCIQAGTNCTIATGGDTGTGTVANPWDQVGLMVFPGLCSDTATKVTTANCPAAGSLTDTNANPTYAPPDYACPSIAPPIAAYNNDPEYLLLPFQGNYRISDTLGLNTGSDIFQAIGAGTSVGAGACGLKTPGGEGTFYAGVINAAQDYLTAYKGTQTNVKNVIIFLSDGDATATACGKTGTGGMCGSVTNYPASAECQQAVTAATNAKNAGTLIYSISYGSETSGCNTVPGDTLTPCQTMQGISSLPLTQYFFSVPENDPNNPTQTTVCGGAVPITKLDQVFSAIAGQLTVSRLVPTGDF